MNIDQAFQFVNFISNKFQSGSFTPQQFNIIAPQAQLEVVNEAYRKWQATQEITDEIGALLIPVTLNVPTTGILPYPDDYMHVSSFRHVYYGNPGSETLEPQEVEIKEIDNGAWGQRISSSLRKPTHRYPVHTQYGAYIDIRPKNIGSVKLDYFQQPTSPVWNYNIVNNRPVYAVTGGVIGNGNSVDFALLPQSHNLICMHILNYLGMNLSFNDLIKYSQEWIAGVTNSNE